MNPDSYPSNQPIFNSRTYGEEIGEDIREGFEPTDDPAIVDPKTPESENDPKFTIGDDEEGEESQHWKNEREESPPAVVMKPKYGVEGEEDFENVWGGGEPSEPPRENP